MSGPLASLKVLDFSTLLPGPLASLMLADMGTEVLRIESPKRMDLLRVLPPYDRGTSASHAHLSRNKRRLALDLNSDLEGRVPHGAYSRFFSDLLRAHYEEAQLDLGQFLAADIPAGVYVVRGPSATIEALKRILA